jgi:hypothetical protein
MTSYNILESKRIYMDFALYVKAFLRFLPIFYVL